ncbi:hypothetical protein ABH897_005550 [Paenibacillus sp. RC73]
MISQDEVDDIGIRVGLEDDIITSYGIGGKEHAFTKTIEGIQVGEYILRDTPVDFTSFRYHNIGLSTVNQTTFLRAARRY